MRSLTCGAVGLAVLVGNAIGGPIGPQLQRTSVNIKASTSSAGGAQGSGTVFLVPKAGKDQVAFVITAHHVVEDLREIQTVIDDKGNEKKHVRYRDAQIVQEVSNSKRSRLVGETRLDAKIINVDPARDIALLQVRAVGALVETGRFYLDDTVPEVGTEVLHCGAPGGQQIGGTATLTAGIISRTGVRIPDFGGSEAIFDQTDCSALGGSSGGMVCLRDDGRWIGMITLGLSGGDNFHWFVPVRHVKEWAKEIGAEWLVDPEAKAPSPAQIDAIPLEVHRAGFGSGAEQERVASRIEKAVGPSPEVVK